MHDKKQTRQRKPEARVVVETCGRFNDPTAAPVIIPYQRSQQRTLTLAFRVSFACFLVFFTATVVSLFPAVASNLDEVARTLEACVAARVACKDQQFSSVLIGRNARLEGDRDLQNTR